MYLKCNLAFAPGNESAEEEPLSLYHKTRGMKRPGILGKPVAGCLLVWPSLSLQYWFIFKLKHFGAAKTVTYLYVLWLCLNYQYLQRTLIFYHFHYTTKPHVNNNRERMRGTKLGHLCIALVGWIPNSLVEWTSWLIDCAKLLGQRSTDSFHRNL